VKQFFGFQVTVPNPKSTLSSAGNSDNMQRPGSIPEMDVMGKHLKKANKVLEMVSKFQPSREPSSPLLGNKQPLGVPPKTANLNRASSAIQAEPITL